VSLRWRIALGFALVALATAAVVALATPPIISQGFSDFENEIEGAGATPTLDNESAEPEQQAQATTIGQAQEATTIRLIIAAGGAALVASFLGLLVAGRLVRPLTRLEDAAGAVARGDLARRSGLAHRRDEFGQLGRTFDSMTGELQQADESRRRFLQDAAHELRTPLTVIEATSSAIIDGVYKPDRRHIETIRDQSRVLARLVDDLRTISLAEGGHLPLERRSVDAGEVASSLAAGFEAPAAAAAVAVVAEARPDLAVDADPDRLRQMLSALTDNALRHTPSGGTVKIVAAPAVGLDGRPAVRFGVEDTGPGIPADALSHVFERFYQADPSHGSKAGSSGLGLSIVRALAEAHGGRAGAENRPEGGARLWFELPLAGSSNDTPGR
jgi:two-component system sensor histidine kinase BaeS